MATIRLRLRTGTNSTDKILEKTVLTELKGKKDRKRCRFWMLQQGTQTYDLLSSTPFFHAVINQSQLEDSF